MNMGIKTETKVILTKGAFVISANMEKRKGKKGEFNVQKRVFKLLMVC